MGEFAEPHRLGLVHWDLKRQSIRINKGGRAKIMVFWIAWSVVTKSVTDGGVAIGAPQHMSPEQADAEGWTRGQTATRRMSSCTKC